MKTIDVDFNARTEFDTVRLTTMGALASMARNRVGVGSVVWLTDGEIRTRATIAGCARYGLVGVPVDEDYQYKLPDGGWGTLEEAWAADDANARAAGA